MKNLLIFSLLLASTCLMAQRPGAAKGTKLQCPVPLTDGKVVWQEVVQVDSTATVAQLHSKALTWAASTYKSAQNVIQLNDQASGTIILKGNMPSNFGSLHHTVTIEIKPGKYRVTVDQLEYKFTSTFTNAAPIHGGSILNEYFADLDNYSQDGTPRKKTTKFATQWTENVTWLLADLKKAMTATASNW